MSELETDDLSVHVVVLEGTDSDRDLASQLRDTSSNGLMVTTIATVDEALDRVSMAAVDCVVCVHDPPAVDGLEALASLRDVHPDLPILLATDATRTGEDWTREATDILEISDGRVDSPIARRRLQNLADQARSRNRFERTIERIDDGFFALDDDWRVTYANEVGQYVLRDAMALGDDEPVLGRHLWTEIPDAVDTPIETESRRAIRTQEPVTFEEHFAPLETWFEVKVYPDGDGLSVYFRDVTDRIDCERELELNETIVSNVGDGVYVLDESFHFVRVNEAYCEMTGYDRGELIGTHCSLVVDEEVAEASGEALEDLSVGDESSTIEADIHRADGTTLRAESKFTPVRGPNGEAWKVGVVRDVSARVEREVELERLQDLLNRTERFADIGGWEVDVETEQVFWTNHLFEVLGVEYDEEPTLDEALDVYIEADRPLIEDAISAAIEDREPIDEELRFEKEPGEIRWLRVRGEPVVEGSEVVRIRGSAQDITPQKDREQRLRGLLEATREFIKVDDRAALHAAILEALESVFGYDVAILRRHDPVTGTLRPTLVSDRAQHLLPDRELLPDDEGLVGEAFQAQEPVIVRDIDTTTDVEAGNLASWMVLPLGEHGVIGVGAPEPDHFDETDATMVEVLALAATSALDRFDREADMYLLNQIVERAGGMALLLSPSGEIEYASQSLAGTLGVDKDELLGSPITTHLTDETSSLIARTMTDLANGTAERDAIEIELDPVGTPPVPAELDLSTVSDDRHGRALAGVVTDISELEATRSNLETQLDRFRELFENLPDPVAEVRFDDGDAILDFANPAFIETFADGEDAIEGEALEPMIVPDDAEPVDSRELGAPDATADVTRETVAGRREFMFRAIPHERDGEQYSFNIYTDITDRKDRERYLEVINRVLRHNLRNEMNIVLSISERLAATLEDDELVDTANTLQDAAERISDLSDEATEIERLLGSRSRKRTTIELISMIREVVEDARRSHPDAEFITELPADLAVQGGRELSRVFEELIENALQHVPGESTVKLTADIETDAVQIWIADDGPGIPDDEWAVVAGEDDITQLRHGSGLGLWLCRWIVRSFGGELIRRADADGAAVGVRLEREHE